MAHRVALCILLLLSVPMLSAQAQSFSTVTGRNHPEIDWRTATTEHFEIVHPARLDDIAAAAAPIAETTYDTLSATLDVTFDERIRVYLSDQDAIVNGFAVPFGTGYTDIWVKTNDWARAFTGPSSWLRLVLAHELTHLFHYEAVRTDLGLWALALGGSFPRVWTEGLAQYQAETWNAQRGERWLRAAVLDDALSYEDGRSLWNGTLLYASGHSQVRYFAQQHGDSTLTDLLHHKTDVLFGLAEVHDFEAAFRETVGSSYETFYEQWRRDMNVYYNTLAGQLETLDSLRTDTLAVPGQYVEALAYSPDTSRIAALTQLSPERPVRRLHVIDRSSGKVTVVAEGAIEPSVAWSPDGTRIAFSRQTRAAHGSLVDDLFVVGADGDNERRLTHGRRTSAPTYGPDGERLAFVATADGTANVHLMTMETGETMRVTDYEGDLQITGLQWHPSQDTLALARVDAKGGRQLVLYDLGTETSTLLTDPDSDDRRPVWRPDGSQLAYTSLRDGVPNAFVYDLSTHTHRRATRLVRGATVHDWVPADSSFETDATDSTPGEALVTSTALTKARDGAFRIPADRTARAVEPSVPGPYAAWTTTEPPRTIPRRIAPDPSLIETRGDYDALDNVTHRASLALPYYAPSADDYGLAGVTSWTEPLGTHTLNAGGRLSFTEPGTKSEVVASYLNRQLDPTIELAVFSASSSARIYGRDLLVEDRTGGDLAARWPLDWRVRPYVSTTVSARLRYADLDPLDRGDFTSLGPLSPPQAGQQASLRLQFTRRKRPPYRHALVHPVDGWGLRLRATGAAEVLGGDTSFLRGDVAGYHLLPSVGTHQLYLYGRLQAQTGSSFPQDYVGLSRYDAIDLPLPGAVPLSLGDAERVRGHRQYVLGNRVAFGRVEYRMPLASSLRTEVLGLIGLGHTTLSAFVDGGMVWSGRDVGGGVRQMGTGLELKNALRLGGFKVGHALGLAQPTTALGTREDVRVYYRVQTALPF
ncbi:MAG: hypothetical protein V5A20_06140 [Salinibacter sp.]|uniref:hypothetical protein n=1 Tax=Salinibacter sp. TaxID=2065818 RepID=UPI002FC3AEC6